MESWVGNVGQKAVKEIMFHSKNLQYFFAFVKKNIVAVRVKSYRLYVNQSHRNVLAILK